MSGDSDRIEWHRLLTEFDSFEPTAPVRNISCEVFEQSLIRPAPDFVEIFISRKISRNQPRNEAVRALFGYLLEKRYDEKLNLLHFAFHIFDDETALPDEIIGHVPFPHEDGVPHYRHFGDPQLRLRP